MSETPTPPPPSAEAAAPPAPAPAAEVPAQKQGHFWGTGRRKTAVARVRLRPGSGSFTIDNRKVEQYFFSIRDRLDAVAPLKATNTLGKFDVWASVSGGGQTGQAQAVMLGVARALVKVDPKLEPVLRDNRYLTRDDRKVERKKYGRSGARKRFQFSKR